MTSVIAERHPDRISGSLSMCGLLQGGVANWNNTLDPVFALKTLLAPGAAVRLTGLESQTAAAEAADAALHALETRITTGHWQETDPAALNARAAETDPSQPARCVSCHPAPFPRPYDLTHPADRYRP